MNDLETKAMLDSIREMLNDSKVSKSAKLKKPSPYTHIPKEISTSKRVHEFTRKIANKDVAVKKKKVDKSVTPNSKTMNSLLKQKHIKEEAAYKTISLPYIDSVMIVQESIQLLDKLEEKETVKQKPPSLFRLASYNTVAKLSSLPTTFISVEYLRKRYPRFCLQLKLKDFDAAVAAPKSDIWIVRLMEECYDDAYSSFHKNVSATRKRKRFGLDFGGLDAFPLIVRRLISRNLRCVSYQKPFPNL